MALSGHASSAYDVKTLFAIEKLALPGDTGIFPWLYQPAFYLIITPLALMPYVVAFFVFMLSNLTCYVLVFRRIVRHSGAMWCLAAFPGVWITLLHGQNAFLTAAIAAAALLTLERRPCLSGLLVGLLAIKPQLALLFPLALIAVGAWRALAVAVMTAVLFNALATAILGFDIIQPALQSALFARTMLEQGGVPWAKMPSTFSWLRSLGVSIQWAYFIHGIIALTACCVIWRIWRSCSNTAVRSAALMTATFLVSPYGFDYDFAWLAFPLAWVAMAGLRDGWLLGERELLVVVGWLPVFMAPMARQWHV